MYPTGKQLVTLLPPTPEEAAGKIPKPTEIPKPTDRQRSVQYGIIEGFDDDGEERRGGMRSRDVVDSDLAMPFWESLGRTPNKSSRGSTLR